MERLSYGSSIGIVYVRSGIVLVVFKDPLSVMYMVDICDAGNAAA
jgi:hypothetical protein